MGDTDEPHRHVEVPETEQVPESFRDLVDDDDEDHERHAERDPAKDESSKDDVEHDDDDGSK